jgi:amino acid transporter
MAEQNSAPQMQKTLGLTGLTSNAMALIAPGAFLWLTFFIQATTGATAPSMWIGIFAALMLCLATAVSYAEISKLYPGTGSSYYYAEQALLSKDKAFKYARISKFIVGWGSHLYYWVYPGVMVGVTGVFVGYVVGFLYPNFMSGSNPGPIFMAWSRSSLPSRSPGSPSAAPTLRLPSTWPSTSFRSRHWCCSASWPSDIARTIPKVRRR